MSGVGPVVSGLPGRAIAFAPRAARTPGGPCCDEVPPPGDDDGVIVSLSPEAKAASSDGPSPPDAPDGDDATTAARPRRPRLSQKDQAIIAHLQARDAQVRAHEAAHAAAAAGLGGRPSFTYQTGPDGRRYAIGGEVGVSMSPGHTPTETIARAEQIRAAALAPSDPSSQDRAVAAAASAMEAKAREEQVQQRVEALRTAAAEAQAARGGRDHAHAGDGCPFCSRAASAYGAAGTSAAAT